VGWLRTSPDPRSLPAPVPSAAAPPAPIASPPAATCPPPLTEPHPVGVTQAVHLPAEILQHPGRHAVKVERRGGAPFPGQGRRQGHGVAVPLRRALRPCCGHQQPLRMAHASAALRRQAATLTSLCLLCVLRRADFLQKLPLLRGAGLARLSPPRLDLRSAGTGAERRRPAFLGRLRPHAAASCSG